MNNSFLTAIFTTASFIIILTGCNSTGDNNWKATFSGIQYKVFRTTGNGKKATMMATAKVRVTTFANDNFTSPKAAPMPVYQMVLPPAPYTTDPLAEVLTQAGVQEGDSIITITKQNLRTAYAIQKIYTPGMDGMNTDSLIAIDKKQETDKYVAAQSALASPRIEKYLKEKQINAVKNPDNTFTEIISTGNKPFADSGKTAGIKYTVINIVTNKVINSNRDTAFHQPPVLEFQVGKGFMVRSVDKVVRQLGKGGHARIYLPGVVAAGPKISDPSAKLNEDIVFDVELLFVK